MIRATIFSLALGFLLASTNCSHADEGDPVAIRVWPGGGVTIETMWNLRVGHRLTDGVKEQLSQSIDVDSASLTKPGDAITLRRLPNEAKPALIAEAVSETQDNDLVVSSVNNEQSPGVILVSVDGVNIYLLNGDVAKQIEADPDLAPKLFKNTGGNNIVVLDPSCGEQQALAIANAAKPAMIIVPPSLTKVGDTEVVAINHNAVAVSFDSDEKKKSTRFVSLTDKPYEMSDELSDLFQKKETACKDSRALFASLSIPQMNFRPANGTHTPRWNTEHMMGRELLFFSQIYHAIDPSIPVMDLNPRQMPDDYEMAHPDWTGAEEARQTERVETFTRRFAFLLDGVELDRKAKGSKFWTPRALLKQMERHYNEHTANVRKKMQLEEWPKE